MPLGYDLKKIKFATDEVTYQRAVDLYERGKVTDVKEDFGDFSAVVLGTKSYRVSVSGRRFKDAHCTCYVGEQGTLCKHAVALALYAVLDGKALSKEDKVQQEVKFSGRMGEFRQDELAAVKESITDSMKYIKPYSGPSRTWFANQDSLREGCARLSDIVSQLPVNKHTADILVKLLLRLDKKLQTSGVDDSNGIVGGFMSDVAGILIDFARMDPACIDAFEQLRGKETCFDWEDPLVRIFDERNID